jgi:peptidoglycan/xylan/chitin deacetylase (PgdA/CDA1 family)
MIMRTALSLASRGRLSILIFHRIVAERDPLLPEEPTAAEFERLILHLKRRFTILPLRVAVDRLREGTLPASALAITFDDGYADNANIAAPLLRKHGVPATVFVVTGLLDGGVMWNDRVLHAFRSSSRKEIDLDSLGLGRHGLTSFAERRAASIGVLRKLKYRPVDERERAAHQIVTLAEASSVPSLMMTSEEVRSLHRFDIDVGAHTVTHPILAGIDDHRAWHEIAESKRTLEALLSRPIALFAYPNGLPGKDYRPEHVRMAKEAGFRAAVSTAWGAARRDGDPMQMPRYTPWTLDPLRFDCLMWRNARLNAQTAETALC